MDATASREAYGTMGLRHSTGSYDVRARSNRPKENIERLLQRVGLHSVDGGAVQPLDVTGRSAPSRVEGLADMPRQALGGELPPVAPRTSSFTEDEQRGAASFAISIDSVVDELFGSHAKPLTSKQTKEAGAGVVPLRTAPALADLRADRLLAVFLKLNISDPNNSVETHNRLHQLSSNLRQQAIREAQKKLENAHELMKEAEAYAAKISWFATIAQWSSLVFGLVGTPMIVAAISAATQVAQAAAQKKATDQILDAQAMDLQAKRHRYMAEVTQQMVENEAELVNTIIETKNRVVDSVLKMQEAAHLTNVRMLSAGMAR